MNYSKQTDQKWQEKWKRERLYKYVPESKKKKFYTMEMFPYPSGASLHLGHWFNFAPADSFSRYKSMQGYNVFHPMGFDAFGLPAENYAIKTGISPKVSTAKNVETMRRQLEEMGVNYDWDYSVETYKPEYYKWTQWIFTQLYKQGLAYKKNSLVNWCDSCKTVLANEQVVNCKCERCGTPVERKKMEQWFFKTTEYAEELLKGLDKLEDWPETTKKIQSNWIGKSNGSEIRFMDAYGKFDISVFTTRPDTINGVSYIVVAPESDLVTQITKEEYREDVRKYIEQTGRLTEIERLSSEREKTGVFTGAYVVNPINGEKIPVWIADYVLDDYGTGAVMAVPAHDKRDYEFAKKYKLTIKEVILGNESREYTLPYTGKGTLINSGKYNGLTTEKAKKVITTDLEREQRGKKITNYKLKDWSVSRQRYWGAPIPIINCKKCGPVAVPEKDLPVLLPDNVEFRPDGVSPLKKSKEFLSCNCPNCGEPAEREAETLDTFVCSSWYQLRYPNPHDNTQAFDKEKINKMCPVDVYVGGKEHAAMHLIYSRFMTKALRDMGYLNFDEPFKKLVHQGLILGPDGNKMSKSKGNTVSPDEYIDKYGADVFRMYLMFSFDFSKGGPWSDKGVESMSKYFEKIEKIVTRQASILQSSKIPQQYEMTEKERELLRAKSQTIKSMSTDIENFKFNTSIARSMELLNSINKYTNDNDNINEEVLESTVEDYIRLLAPLAPHFAEEQWQKLGKEQSVHKEEWPRVNEKELNGGTKNIPIQVNGKLRALIPVSTNATAEEILETIKSNYRVTTLLSQYDIKKEIYIPGRIYNIVVNKKNKRSIDTGDNNK